MLDYSLFSYAEQGLVKIRRQLNTPLKGYPGDLGLRFYKVEGLVRDNLMKEKYTGIAEAGIFSLVVTRMIQASKTLHYTSFP